MEFIDGVDCDSNDVELVAKAVQTLIGLQAPPALYLDMLVAVQDLSYTPSFLTGYPMLSTSLIKISMLILRR